VCGLGFVAEINGNPSHDLVDKGLEILKRLAHRGAAGSDPESGDGAGILLQVPHAFFQHELERKIDKELPLPGDYGVIQCFLSRDKARCQKQMRVVESVVRYHNQIVIGWRDVPVDPSVLGPLANGSRPTMKQLFVARVAPAQHFERTLFMIRKRAGRLVQAQAPDEDFYIASCSSKTIVYKGLALPEKLAAFYGDLADPNVRTSIAVVHSRFSTNTFPTWQRAHPYRLIAHNGEINTLRGNQTWMGAREPLLESPAFAEHIADFKPIIRPGGSDSASLDNVVDFLVASGRPLPHVMMMLVPEAWSTQVDMPSSKRAFYEYHSALVEPWDGPAALVFSDGNLVGATLDRNGLRPAKYVVTKGGLVVMASELGVLDFEPEDVVEKGRLTPGKMLLVDVARKCIVTDDEIKRDMATRQPYELWVEENKIDLASLPAALPRTPMPAEEREMLERAFGYSREQKRVVLEPMATKGEEPTGSMGNDTALAVLSDRPQPLFRYFKQQFAQVTNPPIDPIREELVMSLTSCVGGEGNLLGETPRQCRMLELPHPILTNDDMARLDISALEDFRVARVASLFDAAGGEEALSAGLDELCAAAIAAVSEGASIVVISDRGVTNERAAIPSLLACSAVHHALIRAAKRMHCGLVVESAEPREVTDVALLIGFGAGAVNPYLALEIAAEVGTEKNYVKALKKGLLKILAKMGISALSSYQGAQIFEAIGISEGVIERYFPGTASRLSGIGLGEIARETVMRHAGAFNGPSRPRSDDGEGVYAWRAEGERHAWSPDAIAKLQRAVRAEDASSYEEFAKIVNEAPPVNLRALWDFQSSRSPVPIDQVETAAQIVRRFATGAMSFGSISKEAHENLAIAMNRIGGKSNSGEGGEDAERYGTDRRSAIKQVASARFGVTTHYLSGADELQIKIAQGAKPGEGGQLPGHKVDDVIARVRHATPGVTLISPPPHHDIYSIEDLAQLVFDLKCVNPRARVSVKLVSESGVGTVAAGVVKAHADAVHVAGHDGGTGASPMSSIHHAGTPWELGLAETQQVLVSSGLRSRVRVQVDGQLKTGRDVAFAALLGAEEFGFATAPLVASGCVMMRKCHLNTCPVGIATQDPILRARFRGTPEHVVRYFFYVAEELRGIMAKLGFRTLDEMVGRVEHIVPKTMTESGLGADKARTLDFGDVLLAPDEDQPLRCTTKPPQTPVSELDEHILDEARLSLKYREPTTMRVAVTNADRAIGARLAGEIARVYGELGLPDGTITIEATGTAGQSFGAFAAKGMLVVLEGDANDYVGKGLSGGIIAALPPRRSKFRACDNVIVGNTVLYGATSGKAFFAGRAGERFAVRNSGATVVVEGVGDHACEYMTGGTVVVLGSAGRNFAAGMSGGVAYVFDPSGDLALNKATELECAPLDAADVEIVRGLVEDHVQYTRSARGAALLADFGSAQRRFVRVVPLEYKRALANKKGAA
jgi:glutamate synthase (NADPH/NADH) large chain